MNTSKAVENGTRETTAPTAPDFPPLAPSDEHNRALAAHVRPLDWTNPTPAGRYHLVVVGAGTGGLVSAAIAAGLGARVALVERSLMGGDCLNTGCVPSKALLAAARAWRQAASAEDAFGGPPVVGPGGDFAAVMRRMRRIRAEIAPVDGAERFHSLGVDVFLGEGRFTGPDTLTVDGGSTLRFRRAILATGARATVPPIDGLERAGYLTNETVFSIEELPDRLVVIGAGPIGCELAQAFARFGADVTLVDLVERPLPKEDPDASAVVRAALEREGVDFIGGARITRVRRRDADRIVAVERAGERLDLEASH
ncbi:MAG: FAD-dependent oxidoreductase, partial [Gemmatimonadota bacterium]